MTPEQRNALVRENMPLVGYVLSRLPKPPRPSPGYDGDDLAQAGRMGLMAAARRFDPARGLQFSTFACNYIRGYILTCCNKARPRLHVPVYLLDQRKNNGRPGQPVSPELKALARKALACRSLGEWSRHLPGRWQPPDDAEEQAVWRRRLMDAVNALPWRERRVIVRRYGLGRPAVSNMRVIGEEFGVTKQRIAQILQQAEGRLRRQLAG